MTALYMNEYSKQLLSDKIIAALLFGSLFFIVIHIIFLAFTFKNTPPFIPLFNQMPWGENRLGTKPQIFIPIGIVIFLGICNIVLSSAIHKTMPLISRFLIATIFVLSILALLIVIRTILIVI